MGKQTTPFKNGPNTLTSTSPKKIYRWKISTLKDTPHRMSLQKCKLKQGDTTIHLLDGPNPEH